MFFYGGESEFVIQPFLRRKINDLAFCKDKLKEEYFDIISPYGYSGPIHKTIPSTDLQQLYNEFFTQSTKYCEKNNIITEFTRFHPLLKNHQFYEEKNIDARNVTVSIDLTKDTDYILKNMNKKTRNLIRKGEKSNLEVIHSTNESDVDEFISIYSKTMEKNSAKEEYFLEKQFFINTIKYLKNSVSLFAVKSQNKTIASALFMHYGKFIHYHFSGSLKEYLSLAPNNFLLFKIIEWAKSNNYKTFHLGGGYSSADDSLFRFKSGFSKDTNQFYTYSKTHNHEMYNILCELKNEYEKIADEEITSIFFPYYRLKSGR
ncbi:hypothetical protein BVX95_00715 [archaeon D22]|nr:hypothetical protein BVX95_00715 [archaeon D22]